MKKWLEVSLVGVTLAMLIVVACAPQAKPVSPPPTAPATTAPVATQVPAATPKAEDAAWAKVVEAAKKEGTVNVYSTTFSGDVGIAVSKAFKDRYGITIDAVVGKGTGFLERIKIEKRIGKMVADMVEGGPVDIQAMEREKQLASTGDMLPVLREKGVWVMDPISYSPKEKTLILWRFNEQPTFISTLMVKPGEAPNSWKDLLDPKWEGKMIVEDPLLGSFLYKAIVGLMDKKIWDEDYIKALFRQKLRFPKAMPDAFRMLSTGEAYLLVQGGDGPAAPFVMEGSPIQAIDMREGMVLNGNPLAAVSGGPHPNATLLLINWLLSPEGQTAYGKTRGGRMMRSDVPDFRPPGSWVKMTNPILLTLEQLDNAGKLYQERWLDKVVGR